MPLKPMPKLDPADAGKKPAFPAAAAEDPALGLLQIVAPDGTIVRPDLMPKLDDALLRKFYTEMVLNRKMEERFITLAIRSTPNSSPSTFRPSETPSE